MTLRLLFSFFFLFLFTVTTLISTASGATSCRTSCGSIQINYPFGIDKSCGSPQFSGMLNCSSTDLYFITPSGGYKVRSIDYDKNTMVVFDPSMSTCSILQPHHDFKLSDIQNVVIRPSYDTVFALFNCSDASPVKNRYQSLCFSAAGHSCDELYSSCASFRIFNTTASPSDYRLHTLLREHRPQEGVDQAGDITVQAFVSRDQLVGEGQTRHEPSFLEQEDHTEAAGEEDPFDAGEGDDSLHEGLRSIDPRHRPLSFLREARNEYL